MDMERTQVYLPKRLKKELHSLAEAEGSNLSAMLRLAGELLLKEKIHAGKKKKEAFDTAVDRAFGIWKDRDPKEFEETRRSADRSFPGWND